MNNLGHIYQQGRGVEQDYKKAIHYLKMGVKNDNSRAMGNMGAMYHNGYGVEKDPQKAIDYYEMAVEKGCTTIMTDLKKLLQENIDENIKERIAMKSEIKKLKKEIASLKEENEILNLLPDAPGYHEAKKRFDASMQ